MPVGLGLGGLHRPRAGQRGDGEPAVHGAEREPAGRPRPRRSHKWPQPDSETWAGRAGPPRASPAAPRWTRRLARGVLVPAALHICIGPQMLSRPPRAPPAGARPPLGVLPAPLNPRGDSSEPRPASAGVSFCLGPWTRSLLLSAHLHRVQTGVLAKHWRRGPRRIAALLWLRFVRDKKRGGKKKRTRA